MSNTQQIVEEKLKNELEVTHLELTDTSDGCGTKFHALIVSPEFEGVQLLKRHRMVNTILEEEMKIIHAFQIKTLTPTQWSNLKD